MVNSIKITFLFLVLAFCFLKPSISRADSCVRSFSKFSAQLKTPQIQKTVDLLWQNYFQTHSLEARNALVEFYTPLVHHFIGPIARRIQFGLEREDLLQVGVVGLMKAIDRFDPSASAAFEHFAGFRIQGEALDFLRDLDDLSRGDRKRLKRLRETQLSFQQEHGRSASQEELRAILNKRGHSEREADKIVEAEGLAKTFSLDETSSDNEAKEFLRHEVALTDAHSEEGVRSVDQREFWENYFKLQGLDFRTSKILFSYFFEGKSQKEISKDFEMSDANISRIMTGAMNVLKSFDPKRLDELKELLAQ